MVSRLAVEATYRTQLHSDARSLERFLYELDCTSKLQAVNAGLLGSEKDDDNAWRVRRIALELLLDPAIRFLVLRIQ